ncbi:tetratricopeptide repeat protein [Aquimarina sp. 2201CG14-23]|uniref:tetratricopeptide repeat protein n=1 Tax=Aquimarina mycalae TaxID=3040073 RepID=UPI002477E615|nr:hypothetical protein [Aquimarina sp. 2201CG14-23]MDH7444811.1 hypothetical protein [Aquimarina sp. 2201CG14-23]
MNRIIIFFTVLSFSVQAQVNLNFDKRFVECEDKWVAFKVDEDGSHQYGFIYIDDQAGLTLNSEGTFKPKNDGSFEISKMEGANIKVRLEPNNVKVAIIPEKLFKDLQIKKIPEWLKLYKTDINTAKRQYKWGFMYNGWNECEKALSFLLKAKDLDPEFEGLAVEIAFSYNCLEDYYKAIEILEYEIKTNPSNAYVNKEYIFSVTKTDNIEKATTQFYNSIKTIKKDPYQAENCFNIMQFYYIQKDKDNFNKWYTELKKWPNENKQIDQYAELMKKDLN